MFKWLDKWYNTTLIFNRPPHPISLLRYLKIYIIHVFAPPGVDHYNGEYYGSKKLYKEGNINLVNPKYSCPPGKDVLKALEENGDFWQIGKLVLKSFIELPVWDERTPLLHKTLQVLNVPFNFGNKIIICAQVVVVGFKMLFLQGSFVVADKIKTPWQSFIPFVLTRAPALILHLVEVASTRFTAPAVSAKALKEHDKENTTPAGLSMTATIVEYLTLFSLVSDGIAKRGYPQSETKEVILGVSMGIVQSAALAIVALNHRDTHRAILCALTSNPNADDKELGVEPIFPRTIVEDEYLVGDSFANQTRVRTPTSDEVDDDLVGAIEDVNAVMARRRAQAVAAEGKRPEAIRLPPALPNFAPALLERQLVVVQAQGQQQFLTAEENIPPLQAMEQAAHPYRPDDDEKHRNGPDGDDRPRTPTP